METQGRASSSLKQIPIPPDLQLFKSITGLMLYPDPVTANLKIEILYAQFTRMTVF